MFNIFLPPNSLSRTRLATKIRKFWDSRLCFPGSKSTKQCSNYLIKNIIYFCLGNIYSTVKYELPVCLNLVNEFYKMEMTVIYIYR